MALLVELCDADSCPLCHLLVLFTERSVEGVTVLSPLELVQLL